MNDNKPKCKPHNWKKPAGTRLDRPRQTLARGHRRRRHRRDTQRKGQPSTTSGHDCRGPAMKMTGGYRGSGGMLRTGGHVMTPPSPSPRLALSAKAWDWTHGRKGEHGKIQHGQASLKDRATSWSERRGTGRGGG